MMMMMMTVMMVMLSLMVMMMNQGVKTRLDHLLHEFQSSSILTPS